MKASDTVIKGVQVIEFERAFDERGWFENVYDAEWLLKMGFEGTRPWKVCRAWNEREGTLRGLHYQLPPFDENKLVHCSQGSIMDVVVDLRKDSPTFGAYLTKTLAPEYHWGLWIPAGCKTTTSPGVVWVLLTESSISTGFDFGAGASGKVG